jgi:hypothetical protein
MVLHGIKRMKARNRIVSYEGRKNMRKVLLTLVVITLILVPVSAKNALAVGVNLGTNAGVAVQYQLSDFDVVANVGYNFLNQGYLSADVTASYKVTDFNIGEALIDVTAGFGALMGIPVTSGAQFGVAAMVPVGLRYSLDSKEVPLDFYLRVAPGVQILPKLDFAWGANFAVLWRFN